MKFLPHFQGQNVAARGGGSAALGLQTSLSAFWELEDTNWTDAVGSNALTGNVSPTAVAAKVGNGASLVRASSQFLSLGAAAAINLVNTDFSVQAWINGTTLPNGSGIFNNGIAFGTFTCQMNINFTGGGIKARFSVGNSAGSGLVDVDATTFGNLSTATWYQVVGTYNTTSKAIKLYVNGALSDSGSAVTSPGQNSDGLRIGNQADFWNGLIDQVGIWKGRELSAADVTALYNGGAGLSYAAMA